GQEIAQHLEDRVRVDHDKREHGGELNFNRPQLVLTGSDGRALDKRFDVGWGDVQILMPSIKALYLQDVVDEVAKAAALAQHYGQVVLSLLGIEIPRGEQLGEAQKAGQGCAQLMAYERDHLVLGLTGDYGVFR